MKIFHQEIKGNQEKSGKRYLPGGHDVINRALVLDPQFSGHVGRKRRRTGSLSILRTECDPRTDTRRPYGRPFKEMTGGCCRWAEEPEIKRNGFRKVAKERAGESGAGLVAEESNDGAVEVGVRAVADGPLHAGDAGGESNESSAGTEAEAAWQQTGSAD